MADPDPHAPAERDEQAFFFDAEGARLFAIAHRPVGLAARTGFVLCHPYGEEKQFSYRILARFGRKLAEAGYPVLRFDCRGYGDSEGDLEDSTVASQVAETRAAMALTRERLGVARVALLGLRFGASIAALAAGGEPAAAGLVLWSPVTHGARYLDELIRKKLFARMIHKTGPANKEEILAELASQGRVDFEGNYLGQAMADEMATMDLAATAAGYRGPVLVHCVRNRRESYDEFEALVAAYRQGGAEAELRVAEQTPFWEIRAMNEWSFPEELFETTLDWIQKHVPRD